MHIFNKIKSLKPKRLIVFAVGYTPKEKVNISQIANVNNLGDIPFFYYQGGMNPKKMGFIGRTIVKMVTKEKSIFKDATNKENIKDLVIMAKKIQ